MPVKKTKSLPLPANAAEIAARLPRSIAPLVAAAFAAGLGKKLGKDAVPIPWYKARPIVALGEGFARGMGTAFAFAFVFGLLALFASRAMPTTGAAPSSGSRSGTGISGPVPAATIMSASAGYSTTHRDVA